MTDPVALALRTAVAGDPAAAAAAVRSVVASGGTARLVEEAERHRVIDALAPVLREDPGVDPEIVEDLRRRAMRWGAHQLRVLEDLRWFGDRMAERSTPWMAFKGPVLARLVYDPPAARSYQDLDLSISRHHFPDAIRSLEDAGARLLDANWSLIRREGRGQLHLILPLGTVADVHWHLLNRRSVRDAFAIQMDAIERRARSIEIEDLRVRTLDGVDTLLHLCVHAALGGADRLAWLEDVRRSILVEAPPWTDVVGRARAWRAGPTVAIVLRRARALLGAPVPEDVLRRLDPSIVRRLAGEWIDRRSPADADHGRRSAVVLWPELVREGAAATAAAAASRVLRPLVSAAHRLAGEPGLAQGEGVGAVFKPSGAAPDRSRFMRSVAAGDP